MISFSSSCRSCLCTCVWVTEVKIHTHAMHTFFRLFLNWSCDGLHRKWKSNKQTNNHFAIAIGFWPGWHTFKLKAPFILVYDVLLANHPNYGTLLYQPNTTRTMVVSCTMFVCLFVMCILYGAIRYDTILLYHTVLTTLHFAIAFVLSATFRSYGIVFHSAMQYEIRYTMYAQCVHNLEIRAQK